MVELPITDDCHCLALRRAARRVTRFYEQRIAHLGITSAHFSLLRNLRARGALTMNALADIMEMDRTTLVRALKPLQNEKLVTTEPDPASSRRHLISITAAGRRTLDKAIPIWLEAQTELESTFGVTRSRSLRSELTAMTKTI
jgi:DNA-binding MarR family transcriptional regulator